MAAVAENVILLYPGTDASIPSNWSRETAFDDKFLKAWSDSVAPNTSGGAESHSHAGSVHSHNETDSHGHSVSFNYANPGNAQDIQGSNTDPFSQSNHSHNAVTVTTRSGGTASDTIAYPATTNNNRPPYYDFIFIKASSGAIINQDTIGMWNTTSVPVNWRECTDGSNDAPALGNTYPRGATASGDGGGTGGSFTHTHDLSHSHTTSHSHSGTTGGSNSTHNIQNGTPQQVSGVANHSHPITLSSATVVTDTYSGSVTSGTVEPAYKKLLAIQATQTGGIPRGLIGLYLGSTGTIPDGWLLCDGQVWDDGINYTPDMRDKFLKFANSTAEIGDTGGSNTHAHAASNSHTHSQSGAHTHTGSTGTANLHSSQDSAGQQYWYIHNHTHSVSSVGNNNATLTWDAATMSAESVDNQPPYLTAAFIQYTKREIMAGMF